MTRVAIVAPTAASLYSLLVLELCHREPGVEVVGVLVRPMLRWRRIRSELRRDGVRLVRKVWRKVVLGDPDLHASSGHRTLNTMMAEVAPPARKVTTLAARYGVPVSHIADLNGPAGLAFLERVRPDVVAFTGGGLIRREFLVRAGAGVLNVHAGLLPAFRGMDVVEWPALVSAAPPLPIGLTLHLMDPGIDTGPIVARHPLAPLPGDTFLSIRDRLGPCMVDLMLGGVRQVRDGTLTPEPQEIAAGRQYFVLHPRMYDAAARRFAALTRRSSAS